MELILSLFMVVYMKYIATSMCVLTLSRHTADCVVSESRVIHGLKLWRIKEWEFFHTSIETISLDGSVISHLTGFKIQNILVVFN